MKPEIELLIDSHHGRYMWQMFATMWKDRAATVSGVSDEDWKILEAGPDHEDYTEAWFNVERDAVISNKNGTKYTLYCNEDIWIVPVGMVWSDEQDAFVWSESEDAQ